MLIAVNIEQTDMIYKTRKRLCSLIFVKSTGYVWIYVHKLFGNNTIIISPLVVLILLHVELEMFHATYLASSYPLLRCLLTEMAVTFRNGHYSRKIDSHCVVQLNVPRIWDHEYGEIKYSSGKKSYFPCHGYSSKNEFP